jgi:DNA-binding NtrC family response regulator
MHLATETVLLVEDSVEVRGTLREFLTSLGYEVLEADSAEAALQLARRRDPSIDVVIADVVLPGLSGMQLGEGLLALRPGLPVILMSGYAEQATTATERRELTLLHKPFPLDLLATTIRRRLADSAARSRSRG